MSAARDRLTVAAQARIEALTRFRETAETLSRGSKFVAEIERELDGLRASERADVEANSDSILMALKAGSTPTFADAPTMTAGAVAKRNCERRLDAARRASDALREEHKQAQAALAEAEAEHKVAVRDVVIDEANSIAEAVERLEAAAVEQKARLGGQYGRLSQVKDIPAALRRVLGGSDFVTNTPTWRLAQDANIRLKSFEESLLSDPNAMLE